jgi:hypothetical protein
MPVYTPEISHDTYRDFFKRASLIFLFADGGCFITFWETGENIFVVVALIVSKSVSMRFLRSSTIGDGSFILRERCCTSLHQNCMQLRLYAVTRGTKKRRCGSIHPLRLLSCRGARWLSSLPLLCPAQVRRGSTRGSCAPVPEITREIHNDERKPNPRPDFTGSPCGLARHTHAYSCFYRPTTIRLPIQAPHSELSVRERAPPRAQKVPFTFSPVYAHK